MDSDLAIRNAAIEHCSALTATWGDAVPAAELTKGFAFEGQQVKLVSWGRGIFKPEQIGDAPDFGVRTRLELRRREPRWRRHAFTVYHYFKRAK